MKSFAIVIICYKRLDGIKRLLNCLEKVDFDNRTDINLVFSIDKSDKKDVEDFAKKYEWEFGPKIIHTYSERQGLRNHILKCGDFTNIYDIVALFEDDIYVSNSFYHYGYNAAEYYWDNNNIAGISLYNFQKHWLSRIFRFEPQKNGYDNYFLKIAQSWGQIWTYQKWAEFKAWYVENQEFKKSKSIPSSLNDWPDSSWLKYHDRYCIEKKRYFVYPHVSLTTNFSDVGEHSNFAVTDHQVELQYDKKKYDFCPFDNDATIYDEYMEREGLGRYLSLKDEELSVDLWRTKDKSLYKRYVLSTEILDYKILRSFSISLRPIELAIIQNLPGTDIFLYDTSEKVKNINKDNKIKLFIYSIRSHDSKKMLEYSVRLFLQESLKKIKRYFAK